LTNITKTVLQFTHMWTNILVRPWHSKLWLILQTKNSSVHG